MQGLNERILFVDMPEARDYKRFFADYGPPNLGVTVCFWRRLKLILCDPVHAKKELYCCGGASGHEQANSAFLILSFATACLGRTVEECAAPFLFLHPPLHPFRDAAFGVCTYSLLVIDVVRAVSRAITAGHLDPDSFDVDRYVSLDKLENGDMNWIVPNKLLAFSGPLAHRRPIETEGGNMAGTWVAEDYAHAFRSMGVSDVIRFNKKCYERNAFLRAGIQHHDMHYQDGGNPPKNVMEEFLRVCERARGAVAVHCKAGLGRTGTNIAMWLMKHANYSAVEAIGWCRVCRPGCIVGPQQQFVESLQHEMWRAGQSTRKLSPTIPSMSQSHRRRSSRSVSSSSAEDWNASPVVPIRLHPLQQPRLPPRYSSVLS
jgi:cell division cycle 14